VRAAFERSVGAMVLDGWKGQPIGNPLPYFQRALADAGMSGQLPNSAGTVESVLYTTFRNDVSGTLANVGLGGVRKRLAACRRSLIY
jgi:hypothetical protein